MEERTPPGCQLPSSRFIAGEVPSTGSKILGRWRTMEDDKEGETVLDYYSRLESSFRSTKRTFSGFWPYQSNPDPPHGWRESRVAIARP